MTSGYGFSTTPVNLVGLQTLLAVAQADLTPTSDILSVLVTPVANASSNAAALTWRSLR